MHWKSGPLARSNDTPDLNGFVNTIDWDQNQSDLLDLTLGMHRGTESPWITDFQCWTWPEVTIPVADQKDCGLWEQDWEECEYINGLTTLLMTMTSKKQDNVNIHCILIMHARIQLLTKSDKMWVIQCTSSNRGFKTDGCLVKAFQTQDSDCWPTQCFRQTAPLLESHIAIREGPQKMEKGPI